MANILSYVGSFLVAAGFVAAVAATGVDIVERVADPCAVIGGQKWVSPKDVRACYTSFKVDPIIKDNVRVCFTAFEEKCSHISLKDHSSNQQNSSFSHICELSVEGPVPFHCRRSWGRPRRPCTHSKAGLPVWIRFSYRRVPHFEAVEWWTLCLAQLLLCMSWFFGYQQISN